MGNRALEEITDFIFMEDIPIQCDVIFVPGTARAAISEKAAQLYHEGCAPYILPSGAWSPGMGRFAAENIDDPRYAGEYDSDYAFCRYVLLQNGVPETAILREDQAVNTMENAAYSARVLQKEGLKVHRAIICCQAFHARRAYLSYACHFPQTELCVVPTATQNIRRTDWWQTEKGFRKVLGEMEKCGVYFKEARELLAERG